MQVGSQRSNFEARRPELLLPEDFHSHSTHLSPAFNNGPTQNNFNHAPTQDSFNNSPASLPNNSFNISAQENHNNFSSSLSPHNSNHPVLSLRRQTEGDIYNSRLAAHHPEHERKLSEPASPIQIMISTPEDDHLQQVRTSATPVISSHLYGGYRSRRNSDNPHSPGASSSPGTPGSPESDFNSDPNSPQSDCNAADDLLSYLTSSIGLETPTATLVNPQNENSDAFMDQLLPNSDPVYTILSAPDQISHETTQLGNNNSAITQIQEFEETFNMYQQQ